MPAIAKKGILYTETPSVENRVVEGNQNPVTSGAVYKEIGDTSVNNDLGANVSNQIENLHTQMQTKLTQVQTQIVPTASIEMGETASRAYSKGDFLVKNGALYKVTNAIAEGDALTVGTNIDSTTVVGEIKSNVNDDIDRVTQDGVVLTSPYTCTRKRECIRVEVAVGYTEGKTSGGQIFVNGHLAVKHTSGWSSSTFSVQTLIYLYEGDVLTFSKTGSGNANAWRVSDN